VQSFEVWAETLELPETAKELEDDGKFPRWDSKEFNIFDADTGEIVEEP